MTNNRRRTAGLRLMLSLVLIAALAPRALAQANYPDRPVRILVGFPVGGPPDIVARYLAEKFSAAFGKPFVVENMTGAGGNVAVDRAAKSAPDGHTLVMASSAITINVSLYEKMQYDPVRDLAPISIAVSTPSILVVNNDVPAKSVSELIALAKSQPGRLTYGHAGNGSPAHLSGELFRSIAGIDIVPVSYRGIPVLIPDLLSGRITMTLPNMSVVLPLVRDGKLRALAAISPKRAQAAPDLPTMAEAGLPDFDVPIWFGLMAPAGTPPAIIDRLQRETTLALNAGDIRKRYGENGMEVVANTPAEFSAIIKAEIPRWARLIKHAGLRGAE